MIEQLTIGEAGPAPDPALSQWFSPPPLARELVALAGPLLDDAVRRRWTPRILEPSAGRGNLVRAVLDRCPHAEVHAVEIDPRWRADLEAIAATASGDGAAVHVEIADYLTRPAPASSLLRCGYDLAVCNVPYDGGEEVHHVAKLLDEAERIAALLPVRSLHGRERYDRIWRRFDPRNVERDWWIWREVRCVSRPKFGEHGGTDEIVLLDLRRTPGPDVARWL